MVSTMSAPPAESRPRSDSVVEVTLGEKHRKVTVLGFRAVGKSALVVKYVENQFLEVYDPTIQQSFRKRFTHKGKKYCTDIVDSAGQEEFSILNPRQYIGTDGYLLVYSVDNKYSLEVLKALHDKILNANDGVPRVLVGTKTDLTRERQISFDEGNLLAQEWSCPYIECSAKTDSSVDRVFLKLIEEIERAYNPEAKKDSNCSVL